MEAKVMSDLEICDIAGSYHLKQRLGWKEGDKPINKDDDLIPIDETDNHFLQTCKRVAQAQDRISFKAGYEKRKKEIEMTTVSLAEMCQTHREFSREEVVDWIKENIYWGYPNDISAFTAKLKEWGL